MARAFQEVLTKFGRRETSYEIKCYNMKWRAITAMKHNVNSIEYFLLFSYITDYFVKIYRIFDLRTR